MSILVTGFVATIGAAAGVSAGISLSRPKTTIAAYALIGAGALGGFSLVAEPAFKYVDGLQKNYSPITSAANKAKQCVQNKPDGETATITISADNKVTCDYKPK